LRRRLHLIFERGRAREGRARERERYTLAVSLLKSEFNYKYQ
jgi:hypothetical protein